MEGSRDLTAFDVRLLGPIDRLGVFRPQSKLEIGAGKPLVLLAILAESPKRRFRREWILDALWQGVEERSARQSLSQALSELRHALGLNLGFRSDHVCLGEVLRTDAQLFEEAIKRHNYAVAVEFYGGPFLSIPGSERWGAATRWLAERRDLYASWFDHAARRQVERLARDAEYTLLERLVDRIAIVGDHGADDLLAFAAQHGRGPQGLLRRAHTRPQSLPEGLPRKGSVLASAPTETDDETTIVIDAMNEEPLSENAVLQQFAKALLSANGAIGASPATIRAVSAFTVADRPHSVPYPELVDLASAVAAEAPPVVIVKVRHSADVPTLSHLRSITLLTGLTLLVALRDEVAGPDHDTTSQTADTASTAERSDATETASERRPHRETHRIFTRVALAVVTFGTAIGAWVVSSPDSSPVLDGGAYDELLLPSSDGKDRRFRSVRFDDSNRNLRLLHFDSLPTLPDSLAPSRELLHVRELVGRSGWIGYRELVRNDTANLEVAIQDRHGLHIVASHEDDDVAPVLFNRRDSIVFLSRRPYRAGHTTVWLASSNGRVIERLTTGTNDEYRPKPSANSDMIAFLRSSAVDDSLDLCVVALNARRESCLRLAGSARESNLEWQGDSLIYADLQDRTWGRLLRISVDLRHAEIVHEGGTGYALSRSGRLVSFIPRSSRVRSLSVMSVFDTTRRLVVQGWNNSGAEVVWRETLPSLVEQTGPQVDSIEITADRAVLAPRASWQFSSRALNWVSTDTSIVRVVGRDSLLGISSGTAEVLTMVGETIIGRTSVAVPTAEFRLVDAVAWRDLGQADASSARSEVWTVVTATRAGIGVMQGQVPVSALSIRLLRPPLKGAVNAEPVLGGVLCSIDMATGRKGSPIAEYRVRAGAESSHGRLPAATLISASAELLADGRCIIANQDSVLFESGVRLDVPDRVGVVVTRKGRTSSDSPPEVRLWTGARSRDSQTTAGRTAESARPTQARALGSRRETPQQR
jgi:DNA-binding SARP family transcriptional activator